MSFIVNDHESYENGVTCRNLYIKNKAFLLSLLLSNHIILRSDVDALSSRVSRVNILMNLFLDKSPGKKYMCIK